MLSPERAANNAPAATAQQRWLMGLGALLFLLALLTGVAAHWLAQRSDVAPVIGRASIAQFTLASSAMLLFWWLGLRRQTRGLLRAIVVLGVLARLCVLPLDNYLSNDVQRYLFDGKLALEGFDPYRVQHDDPRVAHWHAQWQPPVEHLQYPTLYPPLALALFSLSASVGPHWAGTLWKLLALLASLSTLLFAYLTLQNLGRLRHLALIALSPIMIFEGSHIDSFSAMFVALALWAWTSRREIRCAVFIALGTLTKLLPILLLLPVLRAARPWRIIGLACLLVPLAYGAAHALGFEAFGSTGVFFQKWRNASPLFALIEYFAGEYALPISAACASAALLAIALRLWRDSERAPAALAAKAYPSWALTAGLIFSPVIFPWYLQPLMVAGAIAPSATLMLWSVSLPFSYQVLDQWLCCRVWQPAQWPLYLIGAALGLGLFIDLIARPYIARNSHHA